MNTSFEQGPIRPPSEAKSLLVRVTRNCPWNRCAFCHTYRGEKFALRELPGIQKDLETVSAMVEEIRTLSREWGEGGSVNGRVIGRIYDAGSGYNDYFRSVAAWLYYGGESVFLQDADSLVMKTADCVKILSWIRDKFPLVTRITTYCRSRTAAHKSVEDFVKLREAGLTRIHIGMESGCDPVLEYIRKGATAALHIDGGRRVVAAGLSLSEYIIPGLGGARWSREHAVETARVINMIKPDFVRLRTLHVKGGTYLSEMVQQGRFEPLGDEDILREIRLCIEHLDGSETTIVSDHLLNLIEDLEGTLPHDREKLLGMIDAYFRLSDEERLVYRLGRRRGLYRSLGDLGNRATYEDLRCIVARHNLREPADMDRYLSRLMSRYL